LANYLVNYEDLNGKVILELGAGCGLTGIIAAKYYNLGALVSTDFDINVLNQLEENFKLNFDTSSDNVSTEYCDWNDEKSIKSLRTDADLIIASGLSSIFHF
jgi:predicted nicotinamide N-methyase